MLLQACHDCGRQYDVSHLDVGARVRCVCDAEFSVELPRDARVRGLRCTVCGGAVAPDDEGCPYCGAAIADERMPCPSCFALVALDARHCAACGTRIRPTALPPVRAGCRCPRCGGALLIRALEALALVECSQCRGTWLDPDAFRQVCSEAERGEAAGGGRAVAPPAEESVGYIPCLDCGELMMRRQYLHRGRSTRVVIDVCRDHGVWLDARELEAVLSIVRARAERGFPEPAVPAPQASGAGLYLSREREERGLGILEALAEAFADLFRPL